MNYEVERPKCLRCEDTDTFKRCAHCQDMFRVEPDYQSYRLPTQDIGKTKDFKSHWYRFKHYDLCPDCLAELAEPMREFLNDR